MRFTSTRTYTERYYWLKNGGVVIRQEGEPEYTGKDIDQQRTDRYTTGRARSGNEVHIVSGGRMVCRSGTFRSGAYAVAGKVTCDRCFACRADIARYLNQQ